MDGHIVFLLVVLVPSAILWLLGMGAAVGLSEGDAWRRRHHLRRK